MNGRGLLVNSVLYFPKIRMAQFGASFKESWQIRD